MKKETWAQRFSGARLDFLNPLPSQINIHDLAKGLARQARFCGQTKGRYAYSVAQHSVLASLLVPKRFALYALFHDGSEAAMGDMCTPLKQLLPEYIRLEAKMQSAIQVAFGMEPTMPVEVAKAVKAIDTMLMATEKEQFVPDSGHQWPALEGVRTLNIALNPMPPEQAEFYFLDRYVSIINDKPFIKDRALWQEQENRDKVERYAESLEDPCAEVAQYDAGVMERAYARNRAT